MERILAREIVLERDGPLEGDSSTSSTRPTSPWITPAPDRWTCGAAERVALAAIGAATASAPTAVLGDVATDLPRLCELVDQALAVGQVPDGTPRLLAALPGLLADAHHAARSREEVSLARLSTLYVLASQVLTKTGEYDQARTTIDRALVYADLSGSPLATAAAAREMSIILRHQGEAAAAQRHIMAAVARVEATGLTTDAQASAYAQMLCTQAYTAAVAGDRAQALTMIQDARRAARSLPDQAPDGRLFPLTPAAVQLYAVGVHWALGDAGPHSTSAPPCTRPVPYPRAPGPDAHRPRPRLVAARQGGPDRGSTPVRGPGLPRRGPRPARHPHHRHPAAKPPQPDTGHCRTRQGGRGARLSGASSRPPPYGDRPAAGASVLSRRRLPQTGRHQDGFGQGVAGSAQRHPAFGISPGRAARTVAV
ncbi:hypothetical protein [Kitasatospora fiedleri]|uniref:hypothetical protein n=1 Tax=Kitasatospora fiedleri TaxID=2991545 RepID=UPI00249C28C6|nr:hypothetical protein [Kitasatospora fiedleri]